jgi:hypothetical protein
MILCGWLDLEIYAFIVALQYDYGSSSVLRTLWMKIAV